MNPGDTVKPVASISVVPMAFSKEPIAAMVSALIPRLPTNAGFPEPSTSVPFFMRTSKLCGSLQEEKTTSKPMIILIFFMFRLFS